MEEEEYILGVILLGILVVRHAIDVMHLTKNLCVNLLGFLGVYGKPKDTLEARQDLQRMKQRAALHPEKRDKRHHYLGPTCYTLSKEEKQSMFDYVRLFEQHQGPIRLLFEYKEATELEREEIRTRKVP